MRLHRSLPLLLVLTAATTAVAADTPWRGETLFQDPEWRKSFLGSYGFLSGAEPQVAAAELELLREVLELMRANPRAAASVLAQQTGPDRGAALDFILANLEFQVGELDAAQQHYESAIGKFPDFRRAHKNLGLLYVQKGDFEQGLAHLSRAVELGDRDGRNYGLMGYCYVNQENYLAAEVAYRNAILQQPKARDWKLGLARSLLATEKYREALALFDALLEERPSDDTLWMLQANAYVGLDKPMAAAVNLEAVRMMGKARNSSLVLLGDIYMNAQMPDLAKDVYLDVVGSDEGAERFETAARAAELLIRARAFSEAGELLDSIGKRYGKLDEEDSLRFLTLEAKVARGQGRPKEAARVLESIVERDGTRGDALLELSAFYRDQGDRERAILLIERAERLEEFEYPALIEHAQFEVSARDYPKAAALLRRALEIRREPRVETFLARVEEAARR